MKKRWTALLIATALFFGAAAPVSAAGFFYGDTPIEYRMGGLQEFILEVQEAYKDEVSLDTLFNGIYEGLLDSLGDPWSYYFSYDDGREYYAQVDEAYAGVGLTCRAFSDGELLVVALIEGGPADKAGIKSGDLITKINNVPTAGLDPQEAVNMLRGEAGSVVTLTIVRDEETLIVPLTRSDIVNRESVTGSMLSDSIGYLRIDAFDPGTAEQFGAALTRLRDSGARAMVLDLRGCPGGYVEEAVKIADLLIGQGGVPITSYVRKGEVLETKTSTRSAAYHLPTVCLVDRETASASELLTAALQENRIAYIIGEKTYGKGVAQIVEDTVQNHGYRLSVYYFRTPSGADIDGVGVIPDRTVKNSGNLSAEEREAINSVLAPMTEEKKYRAGETGLNVYAAQQRLRALGFDLPLTAVMDRATVEAVEEIQRQTGGYPYACLDYTTMESLERLFQEYVNGSGEDAQLAEATAYLNERLNGR